MSATEEFNNLVNRTPLTLSSHPEDYNSDSDPHHSDQEPSHPQKNDSSDDDDDDNMVSSRAPAYHVPRTVHEANTGPKGVIADAQAFERARKKSFRRTLLGAARFENGSPFSKSSREPSPTGKSSSAEEDDEDRFMEKWRTSRMQHLQRKNRHSSPRGRQFGTMDLVNASGYLDAIEKVTADTVVVVCIYDDQSDDSAIVEECLETIAQRQTTTRFVKMHRDIADMDHIDAPAILAYRGGDVFATIVDILRNIPRGRPCSANSLEDLLKMNRVL